MKQNLWQDWERKLILKKGCSGLVWWLREGGLFLESSGISLHFRRKKMGFFLVALLCLPCEVLVHWMQTRIQDHHCYACLPHFQTNCSFGNNIVTDSSIQRLLLSLTSLSGEVEAGGEAFQAISPFPSPLHHLVAILFIGGCKPLNPSVWHWSSLLFKWFLALKL